MELTTHYAFGVAVGLVFFGSPEAALLIGFGALIPDLDREYWFMPWRWYRDEQYHRALFHNVFILALTYVLNPFISLGVFLHIFQDSFTTVRDRGVEPMYPFSRLVKRGWLSGDYNEEEHPAAEHIYFYQEDNKGLINDADPDLREEGDLPVPWRRIYGFALNSRILDRWFLTGSLALVALWLTCFWPANFDEMISYIYGVPIWLLGYVAIAIIYLAGELDRHDEWPAYPSLVPLKVPILIVGLATLFYWIYLNRDSISINIGRLWGYIPIYFVGVLLVAAAGALVIYIDGKTHDNRII